MLCLRVHAVERAVVFLPDELRRRGAALDHGASVALLRCLAVRLRAVSVELARDVGLAGAAVEALRQDAIVSRVRLLLGRQIQRLKDLL